MLKCCHFANIVRCRCQIYWVFGTFIRCSKCVHNY